MQRTNTPTWFIEMGQIDGWHAPARPGTEARLVISRIFSGGELADENENREIGTVKPG